MRSREQLRDVRVADMTRNEQEYVIRDACQRLVRELRMNADRIDAILRELPLIDERGDGVA